MARMEQLLQLYSQPYDPRFPIVCMDEQPYQLLSETRQSRPMALQGGLRIHARGMLHGMDVRGTARASGERLGCRADARLAIGLRGSVA